MGRVVCAQIESAIEIFNERDVSQVVRVIPYPKRDIGLQIMWHFHYRGDVRIVTNESAEEAMKTLAG